MSAQEWRIRRDIELALWTVLLGVSLVGMLVITALHEEWWRAISCAPLVLYAAWRMTILPRRAPLPGRCPGEECDP